MNLQAKLPMRDIVINTGPIIALVTATGSLEWLPSLYRQILIPFEVLQEIEAGGQGNPESCALNLINDRAIIGQEKSEISVALLRDLDIGEASVIANAALNRIDTVAIDEKAGRRLARIHGLRVTGSLGILLKAKKQNIIPSLNDCISRMRHHGIWITEDLVTDSLREAGEL
jgi:predicted nucleic acid-binding protein